MTIFQNRDVKLFVRVLALALTLILVFSNPVGALSALANEGESESQQIILVSEPEPDESSSESESESEPGESSGESEIEESSVAESSEDESQENSEGSEDESQESGESSKDESEESSESDDNDDTKLPDLSDAFDQFVENASITYTDGSALLEIPMLPETQLNLRLNVDISARTLAAILENGDAEYTVHIPDGLLAVQGEYELKSNNKLLGTLHINDGASYFVFNADEDAIFAEENRKPLTLRLDILCGLDEAFADEDNKITVDLGEYNGKAYVIQLSGQPEIAPAYIKWGDNADDFTPFIDTVKLSLTGDKNAPELSSPTQLDTYTSAMFMLITLKDLEGLNPTLSSGDPDYGKDDLKDIYDKDVASGSHVQYKLTLPDMLMFAGASFPIEEPLKIDLHADDIVDPTYKPVGATNPDPTLLGTLHIVGPYEAYFIFESDNPNFFDGSTAGVEDLYLSVECQLDTNKVGEDSFGETVNMAPYDATKDYDIAFKNKTPADPQMFKSVSEADGIYSWEVNISSDSDTSKLKSENYLTGPFTDTSGINHALTGDVTVTGKIQKVDADGKLVGTAETVTLTYKEGATAGETANTYPLTINKPSGSPSGFTFELPKPAEEGYKYVLVGDATITYDTVLTGEAFLGGGNGEVTIGNNAKFEWGDGEELSASASVSNVNTNLVGKNGRFIPAERAIEWTVTVDTLGQDFTTLTLHDEMSAPYEHDLDSVRIKDNSGTHTVNSSYPAKVAEDNEYEMILPLIVGGTAVYNGSILTITYKTPIGDPDDYIGNGDFSPENSAWLEYNWKGGPGYGPGTYTDREHPTVIKDTGANSTPILKTFHNYDPSTRTITWKITVNPNCLNLKDIVVTDTLSGTEGDKSNSLHENPRLRNDMTIATATAGTTGNTLVFEVDDLDGESAVIYVQSTVTDKYFLGSNKIGAYTFKNHVEVNATAVLESGGTRDVSGTADASKPLANNILKKAAGTYNYKDHTVNWTITVNSDKIDTFTSAIIEDTINSKHVLVKADGTTFVSGTGVNVTDYFTIDGATPVGNVTATRPSATADTTFTVDLGSLSNTTATITYKTKYIGTDLIKSTDINFINTAELTSPYNGKPTASITKPVGGLVVLKKSKEAITKYDDASMEVTYQVLINQSQETGGGFALTDTIYPGTTMPNNITVAVDDLSYKEAVEAEAAVRLYSATINEDTGAFAKGARITDFTAESGFTAKFDSTTRKLTVTVATNDGAYILEYDVIVRTTDGSKLTGSMDNSITSDHAGDNPTSTETVHFGTAAGGGGSSNKYVKVTITKNERLKTDSPVEGVEFGLYFKDGEGAASDENCRLISTAKTNASGTLEFNLLMPSYVKIEDYFIKEHPTAGYTGDVATSGTTTTHSKGSYIPVTEGTVANKTYSFTLLNERTTHKVEFYKVSKQGATWTNTPLTGAEFTLEDINNLYATEELIGGKIPQPEEIGNTGKFTITGLKWGTYKLTETKSPDGYLVNTNIYTLEIVKPALQNPTDKTDYTPKDPTIKITKNDGGTATQVVTKYGVDNLPAIENEQGSISLEKVDAISGDLIPSGSNNLENAKFSLEKLVESSDPTTYEFVKLGTIKSGEYYANGIGTETEATVSTADAGTLVFRGLDVDATYRVTEVTPPTGYVLGTTPWSEIYTIGEGGTLHYNKTTTPALSVNNTRKNAYNFSFIKHQATYNNSTAKVSGHEAVAEGDATFALYHLDDDIATAIPVATAAVTSNGEVHFKNIAFNDYYIVETKAPTGYAKPESPAMKVVLVRSVEGIVTPTITDRRTGKNNAAITSAAPFINEKGTYTITKMGNLYAGHVLEGAVFTATPDAAHLSEGVRTVTTDNEGVAKFEGLTIGVTYTFAETIPPPGYTLDPTPWPFTPSADKPQGHAEVDGKKDVTNDRTPDNTFSFTKVGENDDPLSGAKFKLQFDGEQPSGDQADKLPTPWQKDGSVHVQIATSGTTGIVEFINLPFGKYVVTETTPPEGYRLSGSDVVKEIKFTIHENRDIKVTSPLGWNTDDTYTNGSGKLSNLLGDFTVTKTDAVTNTTITSTEASFKLEATGETTRNVTTTNGTYKFTGLKMDVLYTLTETTAPTGYKEANTTMPITFTLDDSVSAEANAGYTQSANFTNNRAPKYSFGFIKKDNHNKTLAGAKFKLYTDANCDNEVKGFDTTGAPVTTGGGDYTATSGTTGEVIFTGLAFGTYYVKETEAPVAQTGAGFDPLDSYAMSNVVLKVEIAPDGSYTIADKDNEATTTVSASKDAVSTFVVENELLGSVTITKYDDPDNNDNVTTVPLLGAVFTLYESDKLTPVDGTTPQTTGADGKVIFTGLTIGGTYYIKETTVPAGYVTPTGDKEFIEVKPTYSVNKTTYHLEKVVVNELLGTKYFSIYKNDVNGDLLNGAEFTIHKEHSGLPVLFTIASGTDRDGNPVNLGELKFTGLKAGTYAVRESKAPDGYVKSDRVIEVVIPADGDITFQEFNHDGTAIGTAGTTAPTITNIYSTNYSVGFKKQDDSNRPLNGAVFGLYDNAGCTDAITGFDENGKRVIGQSSDTPKSATSNVSGEVWFTELPFGTYYVKEITKPTWNQTGGNNKDEYEISEVVLKIIIDEDGKYTISREGSYGEASDIIDSTPGAIINKGAMSGFSVVNELLGTITLTKTDPWLGTNAANQVLNGITFTLTDDSNGSTVATGITGTNIISPNDGKIVFSDVPLGNYTLTETKADGYTVATQAVTVEYSATVTERHVATTIVNTREQKWPLTFKKTDSFGNNLGGAKFQIVQVKDGTSYAASVFTNPTFSATATSQSNGTVGFADLSFGTYYIRELTAPENYAVSNTVLKATIDKDGSYAFEHASGDAVADLSMPVIVNSHIFTFKKTVRGTNAPLSGAEFTIVATGGTTAIPTGSDKATSDSKGTVTFKGFPVGEYVVTETKSPTNYTKATGSFEVTIASNGAVTFTVDSSYSPGITLSADGKTVTVSNVYNPPKTTVDPPSTSGSGGSSGGGSSSGNRNTNPYIPTVPTVPPPPADALPPSFPPETTVTKPVTVEDNDDYKITRQTIHKPDGEDVDSVIVTVKHEGGKVVGEVPPPKPKEGYEFGGWYLDPEMKKPYRPGDPLPKGVTRLYAKWLGVSSWNEDAQGTNPSTGDDLLHVRIVTAIAMLSLAAAIYFRPRRWSFK